MSDTRSEPGDDQHPLDEAAKRVGGRAQLAKLLGVTPAAVGNWKAREIPAEHCPVIERETGVPCERLRPDVLWSVLRTSNQQPAGEGANA